MPCTLRPGLAEVVIETSPFGRHSTIDPWGFAAGECRATQGMHEPLRNSDRTATGR
jgi:hypothetical protein